MARRETLSSLAKTLGVSRQTVSNALHHPELLAPETRERVLKAVKQAGYVPSAAAQRVRLGEARTIAVHLTPSFDGINGHILDMFLHQLAEQARRDGYRIMLFAATDEADEIDEYRRLYAAREVDGVILTSTREDDSRIRFLVHEQIPFVPFGRPWSATTDPTSVPFSWIDVDGAAGTRAVTSKLVADGHRQIGYLSWPIALGVGLDRYNGWRSVMEETGRSRHEIDSLLFSHHDDTQAGAAAAAQLIERGATAIVCASDTLALGAFSMIRELGTDVPVIGFDDTPVARALGISSVSQPISGAARGAMKKLLATLRGEKPQYTLLTPTPVYRQVNQPTQQAR